MAEPVLPEEMIVRIFERLPTKPLIRFSCLSKRWRFIILFDPQFAKSQFEISRHRQTLSRRILINALKSESEFEFESLALGDNVSSSSPLRKLRPSFIQSPDVDAQKVTGMSCCNGLVCLLFKTSMLIWNPSTGFHRKLPAFPHKNQLVVSFGFGYVSSTDDYKVVASVYMGGEKEDESEVEESDDDAELSEVEVSDDEAELSDMEVSDDEADLYLSDIEVSDDEEGDLFEIVGGDIDGAEFSEIDEGGVEEYMTLSLRANIWNKVEDPPKYGEQWRSTSSILEGRRSTLLNEALHWCHDTELVAFDLAKEEFRTTKLPIRVHESAAGLGVSLQGCLCLLDLNIYSGFADLWFMTEYNVAESWTRQITFEVFDQGLVLFNRLVSVMETCIFVSTTQYMRPEPPVHRLIRSGHHEEGFEICIVSMNPLGVIEYQETLFGIP